MLLETYKLTLCLPEALPLPGAARVGLFWLVAAYVAFLPVQGMAGGPFPLSFPRFALPLFRCLRRGIELSPRPCRGGWDLGSRPEIVIGETCALRRAVECVASGGWMERRCVEFTKDGPHPWGCPVLNRDLCCKQSIPAIPSRGHSRKCEALEQGLQFSPSSPGPGAEAGLLC